MEIQWHKELGSTNSEAKVRAQEGAPHGTLIGTDFQTAGRGRSGKSWQCGVGEGLMCSLVLRPKWDKAYWGWIALTAGLALAELLERDCLAPTIKWPNDILVNGKKIAGILTEADADTVIVGIGMNLNMENLPPVESSIQPTSFYLETDCKLTARSYAETLQRTICDLLEADSPLLLRPHIERKLAWLGQSITLKNRTETVSGELTGLGNHGQLLLGLTGSTKEIFDAHEIRPVAT